MRALFTLLMGTTLLGMPATTLAAPLKTSTDHRGRIQLPAVRANALTTLYDQAGSDSGIGIVSQNFESTFDAYDCTGADDFVVPKGVVWRIKEVDITGTPFDGSGIASSENVSFYKGKKNRPGAPIATFENIVGATNESRSYFVTLDRTVRLGPGQYWLSFQVNESFNLEGEWGWEAREDVVGSPSVWRNPNDGFQTGCTDWGRQTDCIPDGQGDQMFALKGRSAAK